MRHIPARREWTVDVDASPVIEVTGCSFDGRRLRRGRVYYVDGFYDENKAWREKNGAFLKWAKQVLSETRRVLKPHGTDYIGAEASSWLRSTGGSLTVM
jgi:hypothetical protein